MFLKYTDEKEQHSYWETMISRDLQGAALDSFQFVQPPLLDKPLEFHYKVTVPQYAHTAGPLLLVRPRVVGDDAIMADDEVRTLPVESGGGRRLARQFSTSQFLHLRGG